MKDAVVYYGDSTQINAIDHKNYAEFLKYTEKSRNYPDLTRNTWILSTISSRSPTEFGRKRASA